MIMLVNNAFSIFASRVSAVCKISLTTCDRSLQKGSELNVHQRKIFAQEKGTVGLLQYGIHISERFNKLILSISTGQPSHPRRKQLSLQPVQLLCLSLEVGRWIQALLALGEALERQQNVVGLSIDSSVDNGHGNLATGLDLEEGRRLVSVAPHVDLFHFIRNFFCLECQPNLLAVGAPGCRVSIESHGNVFFLVGFLKKTNLVHRTSNPISLFQIGSKVSFLVRGLLPRELVLDFCPCLAATGGLQYRIDLIR
mmetsp:Transcript_22308/g.55254  ORF Transcript_22308/g.55254 Transcript_22308/m.55254 type:complete len:254 (-) Transcript_22308:316-1077(-)